MKISEIKPYPQNAKMHPVKQVKQIADSIREFGFNQPIVVDKDGVIIVGHGRYEAAKILGLEDVPTVQVDLDEERARAYRLADNKLNESEWDMKLVVDELKTLSEPMIELTGFDKNLLDLVEDDFDAEEEYKKINEPQTKEGDIYIMGNHKLICGDSTKDEVFEALMEQERAQIVFTDPPYNVDYESSAGNSYSGGKYGDGNKIFNDNKTPEDFKTFVSLFTGNCFNFSDDKAVLYMWYATKNDPVFRAGMESGGWRYQQLVIWVKEKFVFGFGVNFHRAYEPCMIGIKNAKYRKNKEFSNISDVWELKKEELVDMVDVWYQKRDQTSGYVHPTQKPVALAQRAFRRNTKDGDIVLDAFGGSGSTLIACEQMDRKARIVELDPKYCDVIVKRWELYTGRKAELTGR